MILGQVVIPTPLVAPMVLIGWLAKWFFISWIVGFLRGLWSTSLVPVVKVLVPVLYGCAGMFKPTVACEVVDGTLVCIHGL